MHVILLENDDEIVALIRCGNPATCVILFVRVQTINPNTSGAPVSAAVAASSSNVAMATGSVNTSHATAANLTGAIPDTSSGIATEWRDKDADRGARQQIARIMCVLEGGFVMPGWWV